jgi:hypothetical protein
MIKSKHIVVIDDRESVNAEVGSIVGKRSHGEIIIKKRPLRTQFDPIKNLTDVTVIELLQSTDVPNLFKVCESNPETPVTVIAGRAAPESIEVFLEFLRRVRFLGKNLFDSERAPLLAHFKSGREFLSLAKNILSSPIHLQEVEWSSQLQLELGKPLLDISKLEVFLRYVLRGTETRHFNRVSTTDFIYKKSSADKRKIAAEHEFYYLLPPAMQPWFVQPFNYLEQEDEASYEMVRYYMADASLQWIHGAWSNEAFQILTDRLFYFFNDVRTTQSCDASSALRSADTLFLEKVITRVRSLEESIDGRKTVEMFAHSGESLTELVDRYKCLYQKHRTRFATSKLAIGHGDSCFSNILYDQHHQFLKFIDPRGAHDEASLWAHPYYDLCKLSHSILGNYDLINHGLFEIVIGTYNTLELRISAPDSVKTLQEIFRRKLESEKINWLALRLGECSLFLSMPALHLDQPNKALAFLLNASRILKDIETYE